MNRDHSRSVLRVGDSATLAYALHSRHVAVWGPRNLEERLAVATEIVRLATEGGDKEQAGRGRHLRIVDLLENDGNGLNLTWEVRDGIAKHSKGKSGAPVGMKPELRSSTIEGQIMRVADLIAYVNHDIDDAIRAGVISVDVPAHPLPRAACSSRGSATSHRGSTANDRACPAPDHFP